MSNRSLLSIHLRMFVSVGARSVVVDKEVEMGVCFCYEGVVPCPACHDADVRGEPAPQAPWRCMSCGYTHVRSCGNAEKVRNKSPGLLQAVRDAVATERERIARLAEKVKATYEKEHEGSEVSYHAFADLLRGHDSS